MKIAVRGMLLAGAAGVLIASAPRATAAGEYLFDILRGPAYRRSWDRMLKGGHPPDWLAAFSRTKNGVCVPSKRVTVSGTAYTAATVCKPHDCGGNVFAVFFTAGGARAVGVLDKDRSPRYFGGPAPAVRTALLKFVRS